MLFRSPALQGANSALWALRHRGPAVEAQGACLRGNLPNILPARRGKCRRKDSKPMFVCIFCRCLKAYDETLTTSCAALRLAFQPPYTQEPCRMVIISIDKKYPHPIGMAHQFLFTLHILFVWKNIRITEKQGRMKLLFRHPFDNGTRTRCATCMQQHLIRSFGNENGRIRLFHFRRQNVKCFN